MVLLFHPSGIERKAVETLAPFLEPVTAQNGVATAYLCRNRSCLSPVTGPAKLEALLKENGPAAVPGS
jgi:uncharacterized protein YyaL (SSP411 family)